MKRTTLPLAICASSIALFLAPIARAAIVSYQAPTGPGGTWNLYEYETAPATFKDAHNASNGVPNPLGGPVLGYLVEIGSALENAAVNQMTYRGDAWIGITDRAGVAPGALEGDFHWTNGAAVSFTNFGAGEPNNAGGAEDAVHIAGGGAWNDHRSSFLVDDPIADPGNTDESAGPAFRYIREYNTESATPLAGVRSAAALSFVGSVPGPQGTTGNFGVREVRGITMEGNIFDAVNAALSGAGTIIEAQRPRLDTTDPDTNPNGGPSITTLPQPYLTDTPGVDDNDILTIAKAKFQITSAGTYTFQVRADDGFALRIVGQTYTSVNGGAELDPLDPSTMLFYGGTGDTNARGVINLAAGIYDLEFVNWEGGGGAYYEVTTAKGAITSGGSAPFLALGDTSVVPGSLNVLRLTAPATVKTAAEGAAGGGTANTIAETRALIATAEAASATNNGTADPVSIGDGKTVPFPAGTPADEFGAKVEGTFILDDGDGTEAEAFTITFGLFSDDGSQLRIFGKDFDLAVDFTADGTATLVDEGGDMAITADYFTGNTNAFGRINLVEATYTFEAFQYEGGGGANLEILYSIGDKTGTGLDGSFVPLSTATGFPGNEGIALVPEPSAVLFGLIGAGVLGIRRRR